MRIYGIMLLALCAALRLRASEPSFETSDDKFSVKSPDGKYVIRHLMDKQEGDDTFGIVNTRTKHSVSIEAGPTLTPMGDSIDCIWAPDSRHFAVNARVGGRYNATELYSWSRGKFRRLPDIEGMIAARLDADRRARLKKARLPANISLRRIWDTFTTLEWVNARTLKVLGTSDRSFLSNKPDEDTVDVVSSFTFTIKLDKKGRAKIIAKGAPPPEESEIQKAKETK